MESSDRTQEPNKAAGRGDDLHTFQKFADAEKVKAVEGH